jgi:hypothetical protein
MARTPTPSAPAIAPEDEVLIREIDEAVREDAVLEFLRLHGIKVLAVILVALAALGGWLIWDNYAENAREEQSETLISGLDYAEQGDFPSAGKTVDPLVIGDDASPAARAAARMLQAGAAIELGQADKAAGLFKEVAADADAPPALRDLARIREVSIDFDRMKPADVIAKLGSLARPGNPYFGSAGELAAMAHLEAGNNAEAGRLFAAIAKDETLPETLRSRARQMAGLLGVDAVVDVGKLLKDQGVDLAAEAGGGTAAAE